MSASVQREQHGWVESVNRGLKMRADGERIVAEALRKRLDQVGEAAWLMQCRDEWGWARSTAYQHLNPRGMQQERDRDAVRRPGIPDIDTPTTTDEAPGNPVRTAETGDKPSVRRGHNPSPADIVDVLTALWEVTKTTPPSRVLAGLQKNFDKGFGVDRELKDVYVSIRAWLDEVIEGIDPFIISCEVTPATKENRHA